MGSSQRSASGNALGISASHELIGCAKNWRRVSAVAARLLHNRSELGVSDMCGVPGQQEVDGVNGGRRNMNRVRSRATGQVQRFRDLLCKLHSGRSDVDPRQLSDDLVSPTYGRGVTCSCLGDNCLRHIDEKRCTPASPPLSRDLLACRRHKIPAGACRQITDDRGFKVHCARHGGSLPASLKKVTAEPPNAATQRLRRPAGMADSARSAAATCSARLNCVSRQCRHLRLHRPLCHRHPLIWARSAARHRWCRRICFPTRRLGHLEGKGTCRHNRLLSRLAFQDQASSRDRIRCLGGIVQAPLGQNSLSQPCIGGGPRTSFQLDPRARFRDREGPNRPGRRRRFGEPLFGARTSSQEAERQLCRSPLPRVTRSHFLPLTTARLWRPCRSRTSRWWRRSIEKIAKFQPKLLAHGLWDADLVVASEADDGGCSSHHTTIVFCWEDDVKWQRRRWCASNFQVFIRDPRPHGRGYPRLRSIRVAARVSARMLEGRTPSSRTGRLSWEKQSGPLIGINSPTSARVRVTTNCSSQGMRHAHAAADLFSCGVRLGTSR